MLALVLQAVADFLKDREGAQNAVQLLGSFGKAARQLLLGGQPEALADLPTSLLQEQEAVRGDHWPASRAQLTHTAPCLGSRPPTQPLPLLLLLLLLTPPSV